ncbi:MAG TPA: hypothetical protein VIK99_06535 [Thermaerobacter sp.]
MEDGQDGSNATSGSDVMVTAADRAVMFTARWVVGTPFGSAVVPVV